MFKKVKVILASIMAAFVMTVAVPVTQVMAAVPAAVSTALTDAKTDSLEVGGLVLVIAIAVGALLWMRRAAR